METEKRTVLAKCVGLHESEGYTNIALATQDGNFLILTIVPRWKGFHPKLGDFGVFSYEEAKAFQTTYLVAENIKKFHEYSALYFKNFMPVSINPNVDKVTGSMSLF